MKEISIHDMDHPNELEPSLYEELEGMFERESSRSITTFDNIGGHHG